MILAGDIIDMQNRVDAVQIHVFQAFSKTPVNICLALSFLEVNNTGRHKATVSSTCMADNACHVFQRRVTSVCLSDSLKTVVAWVFLK